MRARSRNLRGARPSGMSLVEMLVTLAILAIVTVGVLQTLASFQTTYKLGNHKRQAAANVRTALNYLERDLRLAGYGIDPALGFDFNLYNQSGGGISDTSCNSVGQGNNTCAQRRDSTSAPDEIVFYARNPEYWVSETSGVEPAGRAWTLRGGSADSSLTIRTRGGEFFPKGQVLQLVCSGAEAATYVELSNSVTAAVGPADTTLQVLPTQTGNPFRQASKLGDGCFGTNPNTRVFLVERYRYFIANKLMADTVPVPFLMLDKGIDRNGDSVLDERDHIPIAPGIVDLQVAYVRAEPPPSPNTPVSLRVGAINALNYCIINAPLNPSTSGSCVDGLRIFDFSTIGAGDYHEFGYMRQEYTSATPVRNSADAGNIWAVDVALVARSLTESPEISPNVPPRMLNRSTAGPATRHVHLTSESVVPTRNMRSHTLSYL